MKGRRLAAPILAAVLLAGAVVAFGAIVESSQEVSLVTWLVTLPVVLVFLLVAVFWVLFALVVWWIAERAMSPGEREVTHENVTRLLVVMTSFFVFVLGFVVSQEWSNAANARNEVARGAAALYTAGYNAYPLPESSLRPIRASLDDLGYSMVCQDLPALQETGRGSAATGVALVRAFEAVTAQPRSVQDMATYGAIVDELGVISEARRKWLSQAASGLPTVLLVTILIVSGCLLAAFVVQSTRSRRGHLATVIGLALLVALGTGLVLSLSRPFAGAAKVDPAVFAQGPNSDITDCARRSAK